MLAAQSRSGKRFVAPAPEFGQAALRSAAAELPPELDVRDPISASAQFGQLCFGIGAVLVVMACLLLSSVAGYM